MIQFFPVVIVALHSYNINNMTWLWLKKNHTTYLYKDCRIVIKIYIKLLWSRKTFFLFILLHWIGRLLSVRDFYSTWINLKLTTIAQNQTRTSSLTPYGIVLWNILIQLSIVTDKSLLINSRTLDFSSHIIYLFE